MKALTFIRDIFRKYPTLVTVTTVLVVFVSVVEAACLFTVGPLVDVLIHPALENISPLTQKVMNVMQFFDIPLVLKSCLIVFIVFVILSSALRILVRYSILSIKYIVLRDLTVGTFSDFFHARWYFFSSSGQGKLLNTFLRELNIVAEAFRAVAYFFAGTLQLIFYLAIPFYISWQVTSISLMSAILLSCPFILLGKICYWLGKLNTETSNRLAALIQENFTLAKVVLGFGKQEKSIDNLASTFDVHRKITVKSQTINLAIPILYRPLGVAVLAAAIISAQWFKIPISEMAVLLLALLQVVVSIGNLIMRKNSLDNSLPSYEQVNDLQRKAKEWKQATGGKIFSGFNKEIIIEGVSFAYPGHEPVLKDINVKIPKGKMIAFVGKSGAGKSTLIDMIMGFNEFITGRITFDGVNIEEFNVSSYRKRIGYVPQDSILFNMTIRDNLLWAKEDATQEEIKYACRQANADEFIEAFSHGYDTLVGDRGIRLSGGQCQRVALARAILRRPELLILDEATSSLDSRSERLIQEATENIAKETTVIVIAHRLSTIVNADYMYVMEKGRIVEQGIYSDLVKMNGHFNRMVKLQVL
ncbi:MAG: ABC transporter ATP-binding protein [Candidatus Omnitrophota bacterium]|nr:MAG: ABC transporter ATP-binding protein [Candidatus Omnitrophota bacterium]